MIDGLEVRVVMVCMFVMWYGWKEALWCLEALNSCRLGLLVNKNDSSG
jgi:hypothetical protein